MKKHFIHIIVILLALMPFIAEAKNKSRSANDEERQRWISELRNYKHEYLAKELSLSQAEQDKFFPIYDEMDDELTRISSETRDLEQKALADGNATETELNAAAFAIFQQKKREGDVEAQYYEKFKEVLSAQKLIRLKNAERKFTQQLLRRHGHIKANGKK